MPATTNFEQFNPSQANQQTDSQYASDSQRAGGAAAGSLFPSPLANKLFYQLSTFIYAFAKMLQQNNVSTSDADANTLQAAFDANVLLAGDFPFATVAGNFYIKLPNGLIVQFGGFTTTTGNNEAVTLPIPFPTGCISIQLTEGAASTGWTPSGGPFIYGSNGAGGGPISQFHITCMHFIPGNPTWSYGVGAFCTWVAIGF